MMFEQLDFIYLPSRDAAADVRYFTDTLGARVAFAVEGMGTRVAMLELSTGPPRILVAEHLGGERPVMVFRVENLTDSVAELESRGWTAGHMLEIPHGPVCSFETPGGHRLAIYQLTRPEAGEHFNGRRDF